MRSFFPFLSLISIFFLSSCHGILDSVYDDDEDDDDAADVENVLKVDASSWTEWHYIDFSQIKESIANGNADTTPGVVTCAIPLEAQGDTLKVEPSGEVPGVWMRWYDVFGEGLSRNEFRHFYQIGAQPEPQDWDIAVHRDNVRTNGGAVCETQYTSMDDLPESSESFSDAKFVADEWNTTDVWTVQDRMLQGLIGSQSIKMNTVLSSWLSVNIPPIPPTFTHNSHVFIVRFKDGTHAAVQLADYRNTKGVKCYLTINYKYPY